MHITAYYIPLSVTLGNETFFQNISRFIFIGNRKKNNHKKLAKITRSALVVMLRVARTLWCTSEDNQ